MADNTFIGRVTLGTVLSAGAAALLAATLASVAAAVGVQKADDRRFLEAAQTLAAELDAREHATVDEAVAEETRELAHAGIVFAVIAGTERLAGDGRIPAAGPGSCVTEGGLRSCAAPTLAGQLVLAAGARTDPGIFIAAAFIAAGFAVLAAWFASRRIARAMLEPLSALQARTEALGPHDTDLGPPPGLAELDALHASVASLLKRLEGALSQAERFAADAAHELRTPLTALRGELELAPPSSEIQRAAGTATRLTILIERLLVLATPAKTDGPAEFVSLRDVVEDVVGGLPAPERERVTVRVGAEVAVRGDPSLLAVMVSNALSNALKFGSRAEVELSRDGTAAVLRVRDDGPGIPEADRARVFEPFFRGPASRGVAGHGLGLALIAHIARRHGGAARFEDAAKGARLEIRLEALP